MASREYTTLALPNALVERMDRFLEGNTWGFRTRAEVAAAAIREFIQRYGPPQPPAEPPRPPAPPGTARGGRKG